ncbi:MAG TPA: flagellar basal-body rod protein FlgG [Epulopiscium sp.]|nr:flagellar basal-body rod protein FlgG [Candidatus Epulonipiscium sp.]
MMRSLWTAASGMTSQQLNVDTISNNLANVNTNGYKKESAEFKSLLYQTMSKANVPTEGGNARPGNLQVGHGVRPVAVNRNFSTGIMQQTGNATDLAIEGNGFFVISERDERESYSKDGSFRAAVTEDGGYVLVTSDGYPVLTIDDEPLEIEENVDISRLSVSKDAIVSYVDTETGENIEIGQLKIVQFPNVGGLEAIGSNLYITTPASGEPLLEADGDVTVGSTIKQYFLEGSNVQVAEEMVKLIVAQRAYELNSTAIKTADTMLQEANQLKRS